MDKNFIINRINEQLQYMLLLPKQEISEERFDELLKSAKGQCEYFLEKLNRLEVGQPGSINMRKFRKKPVVIDAMAWMGTTDQQKKLIEEHGFKPEQFKENGTVEIETSEGVMTAQLNDYIIKGVKGEYYPCKPDVFELSYEEEFKPETSVAGE